MKRIIKFRAWDDVLLRYLQPMTIEEIGKGNFGNTNWYQLTLEQWTGLYDKNGVEIYEWDKCLVSCKYFDIKNEQSIVIFKDGCFCFQYGCIDDYVKTYNAWDLNSIEVIGNIHEIKENSYD